MFKKPNIADLAMKVIGVGKNDRVAMNNSIKLT